MAQIARSALKALGWEIRLATLSLKLDVLIGALERRYRPDQPRMPKGTPEGGQWIDDLLRLVAVEAEPERILVAGPRCDGFSGGCQSGGTSGTSGMFRIYGKNLCWDCAVKVLAIEDLSGTEQLRYIGRLDPDYRQGGTDVIKSTSPRGSEGWRSDFRHRCRWSGEIAFCL